MKILVLGGTQFVSWYFVKRFLENGNDVITLNRGTKKGVHGHKIEEIYANRHNAEELNTALEKIEADYIIDVSGYTVSDVKNSYEAVKNKNIEGYIFISSSAVYKESEIFPICEDFSVGENKFWGKYGTNKLEAETFLIDKFKQNEFPAVILRPPYIYGEGNNIYREGFIFDRLKEEKTVVIPNKGKTLIQFIHIEDLFQTVCKIIERKIKGEIFNVGNYEGITFKGWVESCMNAFGKETKIIELDYEKYKYNPRDFFPFYDYQYYLDIRKISDIYTPQISMKEGLEKSLKWYLENEDKVMKRNHYYENSEKIIK
ncbi:NAD-dependent epimerase/dehydratase family protein [Haliovirga abyssi]|uniref:UDP-glucose 4-epimerase n=1 Tax=Haliovirga abyssi TaxID=2996794 RepID=A0AAU9DFR7_9FUSO|nr:NAD-dependent epimerase/dehydratase family protein [Haliovirga abyssi]BDU49499.1 epimerase [Haliovirga abyssi]